MKKEVVEEKSEMSKKESSSKGKSKAGGKKSKEVVRVVKPVSIDLVNSNHSVRYC